MQGVDLITVTRKVGSFNDTRKGCSDDKGSTLEEGGCVPTDTSLGYAVRCVGLAGWQGAGPAERLAFASTMCTARRLPPPPLLPSAPLPSSSQRRDLPGG